MIVVELRYPGSFPDLADDARQAIVLSLFHSAEQSLASAAYALDRFEVMITRHAAAFGPDSSESHRDDVRIAKSRLFIAFTSAQGRMPTRTEERDLVREARRHVARSAWSSGAVPIEYMHVRSFVYASAFVHAIDRVRKLLLAVEGEQPPPIGQESASTILSGAIPGLKGVRDSGAHIDQRLRRLGRDLRPVDPAAVDAHSLRTSPGTLVVDNLSGRMFGTTDEHGKLAEVEISETSLRAAASAVQHAIDLMGWTGHQRDWPEITLPPTGGPSELPTASAEEPCRRTQAGIDPRTTAGEE